MKGCCLVSTAVAALVVCNSAQPRCGIVASICSGITACEIALPEFVARTLSPCTAAMRG
eukprot:CAMPEP_0177302478 /NCGR_PEP_ID=MMETSP0368-20130122/5615_1 /TAXON_ID=447022 ORGANISM="Scrippsiella hangoei-like, Strain SHHI-4" /NCGR_SAMPLE_ID=MMETSP0368 /ASSEMBLY_ACC=CAM_ASM_000363 /LENGTH=58 /DNA_ID=CAMNT_0018760949 /DNA_START=166 /DNA_END=342 /DNA_ORIENTATION=-